MYEYSKVSRFLRLKAWDTNLYSMSYVSAYPKINTIPVFTIIFGSKFHYIDDAPYQMGSLNWWYTYIKVEQMQQRNVTAYLDIFWTNGLAFLSPARIGVLSVAISCRKNNCFVLVWQSYKFENVIIKQDKGLYIPLLTTFAL